MFPPSPAFSDVCDHAKERSWAPHSELLLLGQLHGRQLHREVGKQDDVLHRICLRARHLTEDLPSQHFFSYINFTYIFPPSA